MTELITLCLQLSSVIKETEKSIYYFNRRSGLFLFLMPGLLHLHDLALELVLRLFQLKELLWGQQGLELLEEILFQLAFARLESRHGFGSDQIVGIRGLVLGSHSLETRAHFGEKSLAALVILVVQARELRLLVSRQIYLLNKIFDLELLQLLAFLGSVGLRMSKGAGHSREAEKEYE